MKMSTYLHGKTCDDYKKNINVNNILNLLEEYDSIYIFFVEHDCHRLTVYGLLFIEMQFGLREIWYRVVKCIINYIQINKKQLQHSSVIISYIEPS